MNRTPLIFGLLLLAAPAWAVPTQLVHTGRLFGTSGLPLANDHDLALTLYDAQTSGTSLWSESQTVTFDNGYFTLTLGDVTPLDDSVLADHPELWLSLSVDAGAELPPLRLASVPYARLAGTATTLSNGATVDLAELRVNGATVIDSSGALVGSGALGSLSCANAGDIATFNGTLWTCDPPTDTTYTAGTGLLLSGTTFDIDDAVVFTDAEAATHAANSAAHHAPYTDSDADSRIAAATINWSQLGSLPAGLDDGDDDTLAGLGCAANQVARYNGTAWSCADDAPGVAQDCSAHLAAGFTADGIYLIDPDGPATGVEPFTVFCDQHTNGGGWMRFQLLERRWGNTLGFATDPITDFGRRVMGADSQSNLDDLTSCAGDSQVSISQWRALGAALSAQEVASINAITTQGWAQPYHVFDNDGAADWDQIKGCSGSTVVMTADGSELGAAPNQTWSGPYQIDTFSALFSVGFYGGNADINGYNVALPRYWYLR